MEKVSAKIVILRTCGKTSRPRFYTDKDVRKLYHALVLPQIPCEISENKAVNFANPNSFRNLR